MRTVWVAGVVVGSLLGGCTVWKSDYNALKKDFATYREEAEGREATQKATITSLEEALKTEQARVAALEGEITTLKAEKTALSLDKKRMKDAEAQLTQALKELEERKLAADKRVAEYQNLLARFKSLIDSGKLRVRIVDGQMVVELATDVLFAPGSAVLSAEGKAAVIEVTGVLAQIPDRRYQIAGHTDNVPIRTARYRSNWDLGFDRAHSVLAAMVEGGMPVARISAASYAESRPTASNDDEQGRARNRRIEIIVVPDLSQLPGADELQKLGGPQG